MKILMIGAGREVKGGVSSVVNNYYKQWDDKYKLRYIPSMKDGTYFYKMLVFIKAYTIALFTMYKVDIVHIHMSSDNSFFRKCYFIKLAKLFGKKVIIHLHGSEFMMFYHDRSSDRVRRKIRKTFDSADHIIALSESWKKDISTFSKTKCTIIYNAVKLPSKLNKVKNQDICFLGRIGKRKGIFDLLKVIVRLNKKYEGFKLLIGGDGEIEKLNQYIKKYKLTNVEYIGWIGPKEKEELLNKCGFFALPSYNEGLPMSLLEAMSYGCIPFTTDVGGIPEVIINGKNGFISKPGDNKHLYKNLDIVLGKTIDSASISENAYNTIKGSYSLETSLKKLYEVYDSL